MPIKKEPQGSFFVFPPGQGYKQLNITFAYKMMFHLQGDG